jgi:hypothetical protein
MRDIRGYLQKRVKLMEDQIRAAHAYGEKLVKKLHSEQDEKVAALKSNIEKQNVGKCRTAPPLAQNVGLTWLLPLGLTPGYLSYRLHS